MNLLGLLGTSLKHSYSPQLMNGLARKQNLPFAYFPFEISEEKLPQFVEAVRLLPIAGFNVTIPHKEAILPLLDALEPEVQVIGATNTVLNRNGKLVGFNTDTAGFLSALTRLCGTDGFPESALILGSGGAARAVLYRLLASGVARVVVANRNEERAWQLVEEFGSYFPQATLHAGPLEAEFLADFAGNVDLVVQTTSVGMWPDVEATVPFPFEKLHVGQKVMDLIYNPAETRFLREARARGAGGLNGLPMLIGQAAKSLEIWGFGGQEENLWKIFEASRETREKN